MREFGNEEKFSFKQPLKEYSPKVTKPVLKSNHSNASQE
jgi:hypothetical protein